MKPQFLIRLDDASPYMDRLKWQKVEDILDKFDIKPIVAIIPDNNDEEVIKSEYDESFWDKSKTWQNKGWGIALHGYDHVFTTDKKGLIPRNCYSEFAGVDYEIQKEKIEKGYNILKSRGLNSTFWVAPAHSFDKNTLKAIKSVTDIKIISDGLSVNPYKRYGFNWIPQQVCHIPKRKFGLWTVCLHPNNMNDNDFIKLEKRISEEASYFSNYNNIKYKRLWSVFDYMFYAHFLLKNFKKTLISNK